MNQNILSEIQIITNDDGKDAPMPYIFFGHAPTMSVAEASLMPNDNMEGYIIGEGYYFFNRLLSKEQGKGGGTTVLKQILDYIDRVGVPLVNPINPYPNGNLQWNDLKAYFIRHGFLKTLQDGLLIYYPKIHRSW